MVNVKEQRRREALEQYKTGKAKHLIAADLHMCKRTLRKIIEEAIAKGEVTEVRPVRIDKGTGHGRPHRKNPNKAEELQVRYATICDYYRKGYTLDEIVKEMHLCYETIRGVIETARSRGELCEKYAPERVEAMKKRREQLGIKVNRNKKVNFEKIVPSTLKEGETKKCNYKVACTCVYGCGENTGGAGYCRFSLITNKCRSVDSYIKKIDANGNETEEFFKGCPASACIRYSKISKDNPRLLAEGEEFVINP